MNLDETTRLLIQLINTPSLSREEGNTAQLLATVLQSHGYEVNRLHHNVWAQNHHFDPAKPTLLLNSHHDTVKPNAGYTRNPYQGAIEEGKLYGLGSNDAGGALVCLLATFLHFGAMEGMHYNLVFAGTAEEEISGKQGMELLHPTLPTLEAAIVGEPTNMQLAVAERGLLVLDCEAKGKAGHAARKEGVNALYKAMDDIAWFKHYKFERVSESLGEVQMTVTGIEAGTQHNVVPDTCRFMVDVRVPDTYSLEEVVETVKAHVGSVVTPRSVRLQSSHIHLEHPLVKAGVALGRQTYGSPTLSDQALLPVPSLKMGPGESARSHTADEFIYVNELEEGLTLYRQLLEQVLL